MHIRLRLILAVFAFLIPASSYAIEHLIDQAQILSASESETLKQELIQLKEKKNVWMVVQTIPTLNGQSIE